MSEEDPGSDKNSCRRGKVVQSRARFGQNLVLERKSCPKMTRVQTKPRSEVEKLSEDDPGSNKNSRRMGKVVRR